MSSMPSMPSGFGSRPWTRLSSTGVSTPISAWPIGELMMLDRPDTTSLRMLPSTPHPVMLVPEIPKLLICARWIVSSPVVGSMPKLMSMSPVRSETRTAIEHEPMMPASSGIDVLALASSAMWSCWLVVTFVVRLFSVTVTWQLPPPPPQ